MTENYEKMKIAIRYWMIGRKYYKALAAMEFAEGYHTGTRKDGAPEFSHQISQANYCRTIIETVLFPEELLCVIFLHDVMEDYGVSREQLVALFGEVVADAVVRMSKVIDGKRMNDDVYYGNMEGCPIVSLAKPIDRLHNLMTMLGGFKPAKQIEYIVETINKIVPLVKKGRRKFPEQESAYHNIKYILTNQIQLYNEINKAHEQIAAN